MTPKSLGLLIVGILIPLSFVVVKERQAAARMLETSDEAADVPLAQAAEDGYCTVELKQIVRRVASACGLLEGGGRGCKPADAKSVASLSGGDFNALFLPLKERAHIIQFDSAITDLDELAAQEIDDTWADKRGASFFFVVSRASPDGSADYNSELSASRARSVLAHLESKFPDDDDLKKVGLLWLGEEYAQLDPTFCGWNRSRDTQECNATEINRSAFVAWIDCAI